MTIELLCIKVEIGGEERSIEIDKKTYFEKAWKMQKLNKVSFCVILMDVLYRMKEEISNDQKFYVYNKP